MAPSQQPTKRERTIPVKVTVDSRPTPKASHTESTQTIRPPAYPGRPAGGRQAGAQKPARSNPTKKLSQPVHEWSEEKRRRLMWWLVGGGATVIVIGWLAVVRLELSGGSSQNIFTEAAHLLRTVHWPGTAQQSPAQEEIKQYNNQVFPQFQQ